jgi:hypothetical protein
MSVAISFIDIFTVIDIHITPKKCYSEQKTSNQINAKILRNFDFYIF